MGKRLTFAGIVLLIIACLSACVEAEYTGTDHQTAESASDQANQDISAVDGDHTEGDPPAADGNDAGPQDDPVEDNPVGQADISAEKDAAYNENAAFQENAALQEEAGLYSETDATVVPHGSLYPEGFDAELLPEYSGKKYILINDGNPFFSNDEYTEKTFELYSSLDSLGRCGTAYANICPELMPTEKRGDISEIHPTGWKQKRYDGIVDADPPYLYNRSHLIAYKLAGENANIYNLITGTRYFNAVGMTYVEDRVYEYVKDTGNHVLYRITPVFYDDELVARGVLMEAASVENDKIRFCEFIYNIQPGVRIDYSTGENQAE